jgi:hypothetical protein
MAEIDAAVRSEQKGSDTQVANTSEHVVPAPPARPTYVDVPLLPNYIWVNGQAWRRPTAEDIREDLNRRRPKQNVAVDPFSGRPRR